MSDENDPSLLERFTRLFHRFQGLEEAVPAAPEQLRPAGQAEWVRRQFDADPGMGVDYLQATARHPHLFRCHDTAGIMGHVEAVVRHFAGDGLTRRGYFSAVAADPQLLLQKPVTVIGNLERVMDHYAADRLMRSDYLQAAVDQPVLFRTPPETIIANIEATVDHLEAQGVTRSDCLGRAVDRPRLFAHGPEAIRALEPPEAGPDTPAALPPGQAADPLPSPHDVGPQSRALRLLCRGPVSGALGNIRTQRYSGDTLPAECSASPPYPPGGFGSLNSREFC